jgi:hypothetical protein
MQKSVPPKKNWYCTSKIHRRILIFLIRQIFKHRLRLPGQPRPPATTKALAVACSCHTPHGYRSRACRLSLTPGSSIASTVTILRPSAPAPLARRACDTARAGGREGAAAVQIQVRVGQGAGWVRGDRWCRRSLRRLQANHRIPLSRPGTTSGRASSSRL